MTPAQKLRALLESKGIYKPTLQLMKKIAESKRNVFEAETNVEHFYRDLADALTAYDRKQSTGRYYNPHALDIYLKRAEECVEEVKAGQRWFEAIESGFNDRLRDFLLKRFEKLGWRR